jgi:hypothetical protein
MSDLPAFPVDEFFTEDLCHEAIFKVAGSGDGEFILVHFFREGSTIEMGNIALQNTTPVAICKATDVAGATTSSTLTIGGDDWKVIKIEPDGTGLVTLYLTKE